MNTFFTADTHLNHKGILLHCARKPWVRDNPDYDSSRPVHLQKNFPYVLTDDGVQAHNESLIERWNSMVGKKDRVFVLGDFAWNNHAKFACRLHGKKILIVGNHDEMNGEALAEFVGSRSEDERETLLQQVVAFGLSLYDSVSEPSKRGCVEDIIRTTWRTFCEFHGMGCMDAMSNDSARHFQSLHEMGTRCLVGTNQWRTNAKGFKAEVKQDMTLSHYPMASWASSVHGSWNLYGHCHGRMPEFKNRMSFDVGVDVWAYRPVPMEAVMLKMSMKTPPGSRNEDRSPPEPSNYVADPEARVRSLRLQNLEILKRVGVIITPEEEAIYRGGAR